MAKAPPPEEVGIRELRDHLSRWLELVTEGGEVVVTDRGRPVARLIPVGGRRRLDAMIAAGAVRPALEPPDLKGLGPPIPVKGSVVDILLEQRRS